MKENSKIIGIDPDCDKSGVAVRTYKVKQLELLTLSFFELHKYLSDNKEDIVLVRIEAAWLIQKSNFRNGIKAARGERVAKNVGANHETGRKIEEMCQSLGLKYVLVRPLRKQWKGPNRKITHAEFVQIFKQNFSKTNQEQRDAALLVL